MTMLRRFSGVPEGFLDSTSIEIAKVLGGPSLLYIEGVRSPPLFVTVLQHGNEPTGFEAVQLILRKYQGTKLPRAMWLFVANVEAAASGLRTLPTQQDYNRSWPGTSAAHTPEASLMREVVDAIAAEPLFASVDLHNNTGSNPHYGCVNHLSPPFLQLATLFARTVVFFQQPVGVQSLAMAQHCPAVTLECGQAGENAALQHAIEFLDACLHLHHIPKHAVSSHDVTLLKTVAVAKMRQGVSFGFGDVDADVRFRADLDKLNFSQLEPGEGLADIASDMPMPIEVFTDEGDEIGDHLFEQKQGRLLIKKPITPSMATLDTSIIEQDCLFYVMETMALSDENDSSPLEIQG